MKSWLRICSVVAFFVLPTVAKGQLLGNHPCENEEVSPNLTIAKPVKLTGALFDQTGEPIQYNETIIQVRNPWKNKVLFSAVLDPQGRFDLGTVPAGKYRLVAFRKEGKKVSRLPLFDQPKPVFCSSEQECKLEIVLAIHATDQPFEFCAPK
jgi:hypothetical protein